MPLSGHAERMKMPRRAGVQGAEPLDGGLGVSPNFLPKGVGAEQRDCSSQQGGKLQYGYFHGRKTESP